MAAVAPTTRLLNSGEWGVVAIEPPFALARKWPSDGPERELDLALVVESPSGGGMPPGFRDGQPTLPPTDHQTAPMVPMA
jgi:hypothetical protein